MDTPILFIIFNRPISTQRVFNIIKQIKPSVLYVVSDGPRENRHGDVEKIETCRKIITEQVDWECKLKITFRERNLGSGQGIYDSINWFFEEEEYGIILEDDCLPNITFFTFCDLVLKKYKDVENIMHVSGNNYLLKMISFNESYYFSQVPLSWGWATWKRAWNKMNFKLLNFEAKFEKLPQNGKIWYNDWQDILQGRLTDAWDFQWYFSILTSNGICINPAVNLVENIGFTDDATHTTRAEWWYNLVEKKEISEILHPNNIKISNKADELIIKLIKNKELGLIEKIKLRILNYKKFLRF